MFGLKFAIQITSEYETNRVYEYGFKPEVTVSPTLGNFVPKFRRVWYKRNGVFNFEYTLRAALIIERISDPLEMP